MYTCPKGHQSTDADYCSECGALIGTSSLGTPVAPSPAPPAAAGGVAICPDCGTPRNGSNRFCEVCRYDFQGKVSFAAAPQAMSPVPEAAPPAAAPAEALAPAGVPAPSVVPASVTMPASTAVPAPVFVPAQRLNVEITVDPSLQTDLDLAAKCPKDAPKRTFPLDLDENLVGRRMEAKGIFPEIDLQDPGTSHRHMKFLRQADGGFAALELGSANGTTLNGAELAPGVTTPFKAGDEFVLGLWTRLNITER